MKGVVLLLCAVVLGLSLLIGWRFNSGAHTRRALCQRINLVKKILHDEHSTKLHRQMVFLKHHPHGIPGIPRHLILQGIEDERATLRAVQPDHCH